MDVRAQLVMVFNLDKCIGCHACSLSCKNIWTDRKGAEYMWWNNVETKPGVGYPKKWEDQETFKGGWVADGTNLKLKSMGKGPTLLSMFFQPNMPKLEDYYEPFDFDYGNLYGAKGGDDQPVAEAFSQISGEKMAHIKAGPNWDDDLSGSQIYAAEDVNLEDRKIIEQYSTMFMQYLPRICNHCLNPACVASCPSRAIYKRGEDGVVLVDQEVCKGWRFCTSACPYKKVYYNWNTGKAEKCIFCFPRTETGQCNACAHSCVGRIRYVGVLLYDAEKVEQALLKPDEQLVEAHRAVILDPRDEAVREGAVSYTHLDVYKRQAYYIPSLSPVLAAGGELHELVEHGTIPTRETLRAPIGYLASLLAGGNREVVAAALEKLIALRIHMRGKNLNQPADEAILRDVGLDEASVGRLYRLFTIGGYHERNIIPPQQREELDSHVRKGASGFGILKRTGRGK